MLDYLFYMDLRVKLLETQSKGSIDGIITNFELPFDFGTMNITKVEMPELLIEVYRNTNGMEILWHTEVGPHVSGRVKFLKFEDFISSWKGEIYEEEDLDHNELLEFFHPFDLITDEAQCGFIIAPDEIYKSIYYNKSGYTETERLELDFEGYIRMLYESRAYHHWPLVVLHIINNEESQWLSDFKKNMAQIFPDFEWANYVDVFNSIRLDH